MKNWTRWVQAVMGLQARKRGEGLRLLDSETRPLFSGRYLAGCASCIALISWMAIGCSSPRAPVEPSTVTVGLPDEELCRIRPLKSAPRYITLITPDCASDGQQLGLQSSTNIAELKRMGAQP